MPYSRPLLATDMSDAAKPAAQLLPLLSTMDAKGRAVTVLPHPDVPTRVPPDQRDEIRAAFERRREDVENVLREWLRAERLGGFEPVVRYGSVVRMLAREAETADIVALGATGASRVERILMGSVARGVLRRVACDTLIARGTNGPLSHILFATDFQASSRAAADVAVGLASLTGARVHLLHAIDPGIAGDVTRATLEGSPFDTSMLAKYAVDEIHRLNLERFGGQADERVVHGRPAQAIVNAAKDARADIVIIGSHGEGIASRILLGSVAEAVAERAPSSVLVVRPRPLSRPKPTEGAP